MENLSFSAQFENSDAKLNFGVALFQFEEDGVTIVYSPGFDLSGYGKTVEEARKSFEATIGEFFNYTLHKKTFVKEMRKLGWNVKTLNDFKKRKNATPPPLAELIRKNDYLVEILNEKAFSKYEHQVSVPY